MIKTIAIGLMLLFVFLTLGMSNPSTIVIYRPANLSWGAWKLAVKIDDAETARLKNKDAIELNIKTGQEVAVQLGKRISNKIAVDGSKRTHYYRVVIESYRLKTKLTLIEVNEDFAKSEIENLRTNQ